MTAFAVIVGIIGAATGLYALWQNGKLATQSDRIQERLAAVEEPPRRGHDVTTTAGEPDCAGFRTQFANGHATQTVFTLQNSRMPSALSSRP